MTTGCGSCRHFKKADNAPLGSPPTGICWRRPPTVHVFPQQDRFGTQSLAIQSFRPPVLETDYCGDHEPLFTVTQ